MRKIRVGIIGCGTIGSALGKALGREFADRAILVAATDRAQDRVERLRKQTGVRFPAVTMWEVIQRSDLVLEAASVELAPTVAREVLRQHKQALIMSVGGLIKDPSWEGELRRTRGSLWIPSGAVVGLDGLLAARESDIKRVKLVTTKPWNALKTAPHIQHRKILRRSARCFRVFRGTALEAVQGFPSNINVAAALSLAGAGARNTEVEIWAASGRKMNRHEIFLETRAGKIRIEIENLPSATNPKTSALAYYSAIASLRKIFSALKVGT